METTTNKRLLISESCGDSNRCTPCRGKSDQHATCFPRSVSVWPSTICTSRGPCVVTFHESSMELDGCTAPEKKCSRLHLLTRQSVPRDPPQLLPRHSHWNSVLKPITCWRQTTRLTELYHQYAIGTFNTCSRGPTHRSLTDTGRVYSLGGANFPHTTPDLPN
jgi:hypothetical protein